MIQYREMLIDIRQSGVDKKDRTGTGTRSIFGHTMRFNLRMNFPMVTGKKTPFFTMAHELFWMLSGSTNVKPLQTQGVHIWDNWADENGELGPVYGSRWRDWGGIDQIANIVHTLKTNPDCRRMIVSAWDVGEIENMNLPPCHMIFQFFTRTLLNGSTGLSCQINQRSCDTFLGVPFNIASYALLVYLIAHVVGMEPDELIWVGGDVHVYHNHFEQVERYLSRELHELPTLWLNPDAPKDIDKLRLQHIALRDYKHGSHIAAAVSV